MSAPRMQVHNRILTAIFPAQQNDASHFSIQIKENNKSKRYVLIQIMNEKSD